MITKDNLEQVLDAIGFQQNALGIYEKSYSIFDCRIAVDIQHGTIQYPEEHGMKIERHTTDNFKAPENFVVLECVDRLLTKGYRPEDIELERKWSLGHMTSGGERQGGGKQRATSAAFHHRVQDCWQGVQEGIQQYA